MYNVSSKESSIVITMLILLILIGIGLIIRSRKRNVDLEHERDEAEEKARILSEELEAKKIENLRFALNPHSFRNTLNTIEHLAKNTLDSVHSLSGIFDYMLYDATNQFVPLNHEVKFAQEYLNLYKLRLKPTVNVKFDVDHSIKEQLGETKSIAPLIFAHFIENAFKHGDLKSDDAFIHVKIEALESDYLIYSVRNLVAPVKPDGKGGIGTGAFQERLDLLYSENHQLDYSEENNIFSANLKIKLYDA